METAIVLPVALLLLLAVGVIGHAMVVRQRLLVAARYMAREASLDATRAALEGKYSGVQAVAIAQGQGMQALAQRVVPGVTVQGAVSKPGLGNGGLQARPIGNYATSYAARDSSGKYGVGFVLYGGRVTSDLLAKDALTLELRNVGQLVGGGKAPAAAPGGRGPQLAEGAYMPGELPIHLANGEGLLELNPWIRDIVEEKGP